MAHLNQPPHRGSRRWKAAFHGCVRLWAFTPAGAPRGSNSRGFRVCLVAADRDRLPCGRAFSMLLFSILVRLDRIERRLYESGQDTANADDDGVLSENT